MDDWFTRALQSENRTKVEQIRHFYYILTLFQSFKRDGFFSIVRHELQVPSLDEKFEDYVFSQSGAARMMIAEDFKKKCCEYRLLGEKLDLLSSELSPGILALLPMTPLCGGPQHSLTLTNTELHELSKSRLCTFIRALSDDSTQPIYHFSRAVTHILGFFLCPQIGYDVSLHLESVSRSEISHMVNGSEGLLNMLSPVPMAPNAGFTWILPQNGA